MLKRLSVVCFVALTASRIWAQNAETADAARIDAARGKYLTVKIAVSGPGDEFYVWWGHIGLIIEDHLTGLGRFYDWGVFSFEQENFYWNFARGRLLYSCYGSPPEYDFSRDRLTNRSTTVYTLDIPPEKRMELYRFAEYNVLPENRDYRYHLFRDNCATRIRDIVDMATEGAFRRRYENAPGRFTLRAHARRHIWFSPAGEWILNFAMGQDIDRPATEWEEMYLPSEIETKIHDFVYTDASGIERTLVSSVETVNTSVGRPAALERPPSPVPLPLAAAGCALAAAAAFLSCAKKKRGLFAVLFGIFHSLMGLVFGIFGFLLFFMMFFTDHDYTWSNSNVLFINPLLLAAVPLGIIFAFAKKEKKRFICETMLKALWTFVFLGGLLAMLIKVSPSWYQQNQMVLILIMPFALVLSFIPGRFFRPVKNPGADSGGV